MAKNHTLRAEFGEFVRNNIAAVAAGFVLGVAASDLIKSFVQNIIMPFILPIAGGWKFLTLNFGPFVLKIGPFLASLLEFFLLLVVVFIVVKIVLKK